MSTRSQPRPGVVPDGAPSDIVNENEEMRAHPLIELSGQVDPPLGDYFPPARYVHPMGEYSIKFIRKAEIRKLPTRNMNPQKNKFRFRDAGVAAMLLHRLSLRIFNPKSKLRRLIWFAKRMAVACLGLSHRTTFPKQLGN